MTDPSLRLGLVFGAKLKYLRQQHGLSRESVAARLGLSVADLGAIEDGGRLATSNTLHRAATLFSCQLSDLFFWPRRDGVPEPMPAIETDGDQTGLVGDGLALMRAFLKIPDASVRTELLKIAVFLSKSG